MRKLYFNYNTFGSVRTRLGSPGQERGFYLPLLAISLVVLLAIIGLALDGGRVFLTHTRLQRAVDAGAISAMQELKRLPSSHLETIADVVARENMVRAGLALDRDAADIQVNVNVITDPSGRPINQRLEVLGRIEAPTSFLRLIPGIPQQILLHADAVAGVPSIAVLLVLDRSGSMDELIGGIRKIDALKASASQFISLLDAGDWFGVISFSSVTGNFSDRVRVEIPLQQYHPNDLVSHQQTLQSMIARGGTCIACGILTARQQYLFPPQGFPTEIERFMVVMTDGTPQHYRHRSNSVMRNDDAWLRLQPGMPFDSNGNPIETNCGHENFRMRPNRSQQPLDRGDRTEPDRDDPEIWYSPAGTWNAVTPANNDQNQQGGTGDIFRTIWQSDQARREGVRVFVVGLGQDGTHFCRDDGPQGLAGAVEDPSWQVPPLKPWQPQGCFNGSADGEDALTLRPYLLRRLANDASLDLSCDTESPNGCTPPAAPPFLPKFGESNDPNSDEPNYQDYDLFPHCRPVIGRSVPRGIYLETPSPGALGDLFYQVFIEIKKPRLVN